MKAAAKVAAQVGLIALCLTPVVRQLTQDWGAISLLAAQLQLPALLASAALLVLSSLFLPIALSAFTRGGRARIGYRDSALAYFASQPMKYLPGSFWILPGRVVLLGRRGHDAGLASGGLLFEMVAQVLSSALVAALLLGAAGMAAVGWTAGVWTVLAGSLLSAGLLLASPGLVRCIRRVPRRICSATAQLAEIPLAARVRNLAFTMAAFVLMWLVMGASFYLLIVATDPRLDLVLLKTAVGVSTLSWLVGFLAPFSPGGIGVREGAIVLLLTALAPGPETALVALLSRVTALLVELAFAAAAWLALRGAPRGHALRLRWPLAVAHLPLRPLLAAATIGGGRNTILRRTASRTQPRQKAIRFVVIAVVAVAVLISADRYFRSAQVNAGLPHAAADHMLPFGASGFWTWRSRRIGQKRYRSVQDVQARGYLPARSPVGRLSSAAYPAVTRAVELRGAAERLALLKAAQHDGRYLLVANDWQLGRQRTLELNRSKGLP